MSNPCFYVWDKLSQLFVANGNERCFSRTISTSIIAVVATFNTMDMGYKRFAGNVARTEQAFSVVNVVVVDKII